MSPVIALKVFDDPAGRWAGLVSAELSATGLILHVSGTDGAFFVPLGCEANWPCSTYLKVPCDGRTVTFTVAQSRVDQVRLARDLCDWLQWKRVGIDLEDYRLPAALRQFALLPLVFPLAIFWGLATGDILYKESRTMVLASASASVASVLLYLWSFAGFPSVRARMVILLLLGLIFNGIVATAWVYDTGGLPNVLSYLPGGPGAPFATSDWREVVDPKKQFIIEMPGKATQSFQPLANLKDSFVMHRAEYQHTFFAVGHVDLPGKWSKMPIQDRLNDARGMMPKAQQGTVESEENVTHQGYPGREYLVSFPKGGNTVVRHLLVGDRLYIFLASAPGYTRNTHDVRRFLSSFRVTNAKQ